MVADFDGSYALADFLDDGSAFVAEHGREDTFRVFTGQRKRVGMTHTCGDISNKDFAGLRSIQVEGLDFEGLAGFPGNGCACLHVVPLHCCCYGRRYSQIVDVASTRRRLPRRTRLL